MKFPIKSTLIILAAMLAASCGGGSADQPRTLLSPNTSTAVTISGTISAFGSVVVNGVHYDTSRAQIFKNGLAVSQSDLAVGQVARIKGMKDGNGSRGNADQIDVDDQLIGPIASINATAGTLIALGQTVKIDSNTSFSRNITPAAIGSLKAGDVIEVSGMYDAAGVLLASRIEKESATATFQIVGKVATLTTATHLFKINGLTVDYTNANLFGFASGAPVEGDLVVARGTQFNATTVTLQATALAKARDETSDAAHGDRVEREGLITRFVSATDFDVANKPVTTAPTTRYEGGVVGDLAKDVRVEAEGALDATGKLVADKIEIHKSGVGELVGTISDVAATASPAAGAPLGTFKLLGVTVTVMPNTRFEDKTDQRLTQFGIANLQNGNTLVVRGFENPAGSGKVTATRIERRAAVNFVVVGGPFKAGTAPQFSVLGVTVDATNATFFRDERTTLTKDQFFAQAPGRAVFAQGTMNGNVLTATRVLLAGDDDHGDE